MNKQYKTYGKDYIEQGALTQMDNVMSLDPVVKGALMPDAHQGYGMPIGGVCAVDNAVIPYAVGVDIGCRMQMSILLPVHDKVQFPERGSPEYERIKSALRRDTYFGGHAFPNKPHEHPIMDDSRWKYIEELKLENGQTLKDRAWKQLGTSGGGNHFVEWGEYKVTSPHQIAITGDNGTCLALMSHSGSRALGFTIANYFTKLAAQINPLPAPLNELSWLSMDSEEGILYYELMNLCGDYSEANHDCIHKQVIESARMGDWDWQVVSNHHNFAWREDVDGKEMYVHRKGATPAGKGELGIIPSSMATKAYVVCGQGNEDSLNSASHGSGRAMSRSQAIKNIKPEERDALLKANGVDLLGAGIDESPQAYKNIETVMDAQKDLVEKIGEFQPRIVRMGGKSEQDKSEGS